MVSRGQAGRLGTAERACRQREMLKFVKVANKPACNNIGPVLSLGIPLISPSQGEIFLKTPSWVQSQGAMPLDGPSLSTERHQVGSLPDTGRSQGSVL